jgi:hypothetical protein
MTSPYSVDTEVHIAFNAGYVTPAADRVWTDVSQWCELADSIGGDHGRQDERSTADANSLTLTLDNTDGRFTAGRAASPYYPNVKLGRPIRVRVTPPGGSAVTRFVGFIDEWPVEWDGSDAYAKATIRATSRLARLGLSTKLRSMVENEIESRHPLYFWTLGDPEGSRSAAEAAGRGVLDVVGDGTPMVFGNATGPGTDGLTAAEFFASSAVAGTEEALSAGRPLPAGARTLRCWARVTGLPSIGTDAFVSDGVMTIRVSTAGLVQGTVTTGPNINDGAGHDLVLTRDGTNEILYVDGVAVHTVAVASPAATTTFSVGVFHGSLAHVAAYDTALTAADVAAQSAVVLTGAEGEVTDARVTRILGWAGVAPSEIDTETGSETMTYQQTYGQSAVDALRDVESTEGGVLFDGRDGRVTFHNRSRRYQATVAATFDMAAQHVGADYAPKLDRSTLVNEATVDNPTTGESARSVDAASIDEYGVASASAKSVAASSDALQQKAAWLVFSYAEPRPRVPSLTVDVLAHVGLTPSAETILGLDIGDLIEVTNQPAQADATSAQYFIEGYSEAIGPESYEITFNLSPAHPSLSVFVLDDPVRGQLDGGFVLGL